MSGEQTSRAKRVSRRDFLYIAAAGGGAVVGLGLVSSPALAAGKLPQAAVKYQPTPKGKQQCDNCSLWQPPSSCKLVQGPISPTGWCVLYKPK